jgi:hypothetical protein
LAKRRLAMHKLLVTALCALFLSFSPVYAGGDNIVEELVKASPMTGTFTNTGQNPIPFEATFFMKDDQLTGTVWKDPVPMYDIKVSGSAVSFHAFSSDGRKVDYEGTFDQASFVGTASGPKSRGREGRFSAKFSVKTEKKQNSQASSQIAQILVNTKTWTMTISEPRRQDKRRWVQFFVKDNTLSASIGKEESPVEKVSVSGNKVSFEIITGDNRRVKYTLTYDGNRRKLEGIIDGESTSGGFYEGSFIMRPRRNRSS